MKQKRLRGYVLPTIYVALLILIFGTVSLVSTLLKENPTYLYSVGVMRGNTTPVVSPEGNINKGIIKPFLSEKVVIDKYFYDVKSDQDKQEKSLIYFENTYMKNTGVLYSAEEAFDCVAVLNGTVASVKDDEILGKVVEIDHNANLKSVYHSLGEVNVKVGEAIGQGETIGKSGSSRISQKENNLLFEVYYNGVLMNPEEFYNMDLTTLN